jgi:class 3 adenylate cyclase/predicted ATPase
MANLQQWLDNIGLGQYGELFANHHIDQEILANLSEQDLERLGIPPADRRELIKARVEFAATRSQTSRRVDDEHGYISPTDARAERRHLTVLFCDMVGSTALSTRLDPEDLREILHKFQACCGDAIRRYGGHISRLLGDGVLAYFGFPTAHEDDAERAVNAALQIVHSVSALTIGATQGIQVRIGIATGLVVVGDLIGEGPRREFSLIGEAPNLASRLQNLAKPNQILVAPRTRRLLGRLFDLEDLGAHRISGIDEEIGVWRVLGPSSVVSRFEARQSSHLTPLVARQAELSLLRKHFGHAKHGHGRLLLISGEPGIGKSRLVIALREELADEASCPQTVQCSSCHTSSAWYPVVRHLEDAAGITRNTSSAMKLDKLEALVGQYLPEQRQSIVPLLAALLSIPTDGRYPALELTPLQQKNRTFAVLLALLEARATERPVLLVFEDVHWIDPTSLELLELIRDRVPAWRMLVILLFRPQFILSWSQQPHIAALAINRLDRAQATSVIQSLAGEQVLSPEITEQIVAKTDGVPLFIEEMAKAVLEASRSGEGKAVADLQSTLSVPDTLHESLMARLDQLAAMKTAAQAAAVIGREFSLELLNAIAPLSERDVRVAIDRLLESGLLFRTGQSVNETYTFNHVLVQDEAYASLLREERRRLHVRIAEVLCSQFIEIVERSPEIVAHHYTQAGRVEPAIQYWLKAGRRASERSAFVEAITHLQIALKLVAELPATPERDELELSVQQSLGNALVAVKGFGSAEADQAFKRAMELCANFPDSPQTIGVLHGMVGVHIQRVEFDQLRELAQRLLERGDREDDSTTKLMGHRALGMSLVLTGELAAGCDHLRQALDLYDPPRHGPLAFVFSQDFKATAHAHLALATAALGDIDGAAAHGRAAVEQGERLRHPHSLCYVLPFAACAHLICGDAEAAHPIGERVMGLASEHGFPMFLAGGRIMRGWARLDLADAEGGLADISQSVGELEAIGTLVWVQFGRYLLAQALAKAGDRRTAMSLVEEALNGLSPGSGRWYEADLHRLKGDLLLDAGQSPAAAEACYEAAIRVAARQGARMWQLRATNRLASLWCAQGRMAEVHARLAPLCASFGNEATSPHLRQARALLAETA